MSVVAGAPGPPGSTITPFATPSASPRPPSTRCSVRTLPAIVAPVWLLGGAALLGVAPLLPANGIVEIELEALPAPTGPAMLPVGLLISPAPEPETSAEPLGPSRALESVGATG